MHVYIYDDYLDKSRYNRVINRLEIRLTDLGLNGKIIRLSGIKNIKIAIQNELRLGAKTIIAVGNNQTVNKIIGALIDTDIFSDFQKKTLLGIIPIGDDNSIAYSFGIKNYEEACNILLARRIEKIDLGFAGQHYFLNHATISGEGTTIELQDYNLEAGPKTEITIINLVSDQKGIRGSNPHDGLLDIYIKGRHGYDTHLKADSFTIINQANPLLVDNFLEIQTPVKLGAVRNRVNVIVGKDRLFD